MPSAAMIADDFRRMRTHQGALIESIRKQGKFAIIGKIGRGHFPHRNAGPAAFAAFEKCLFQQFVHSQITQLKSRATL